MEDSRKALVTKCDRYETDLYFESVSILTMKALLVNFPAKGGSTVYIPSVIQNYRLFISNDVLARQASALHRQREAGSS